MIAAAVDESSNRRIIAKIIDGQRFVSCTCCAVDASCCLYDAETLYQDEYLSYEDLPATWNDGQFVKLSPPLTAPQPGDNADGWRDSFIAYYTDPNFVFGTMGYIGIYASTNTQWSTAIDFAEVNLGNCLNQFLSDDFADTYNWSTDFLSGDVSRVTDCSWQGIGVLYYYDGNNSDVEFYYNGPPHRWVFIRTGLQAEEGGGVWEKNNPQDGPAGTYDPSTNVTGNSFAGIGTVTFVEA